MIDNYTIEFTQNELNIIGAALSRMPYGDVYKLIESINCQANKQIDDNKHIESK